MSVEYAAVFSGAEGQSHAVKTSVSLMPLSMARTGETVQIQSIRGKDDTKRFLNNLGFVEESKVIVVSELGGNVIVQVKGTRVAISRAMAGRILTISPEEGKR